MEVTVGRSVAVDVSVAYDLGAACGCAACVAT